MMHRPSTGMTEAHGNGGICGIPVVSPWAFYLGKKLEPHWTKTSSQTQVIKPIGHIENNWKHIEAFHLISPSKCVLPPPLPHLLEVHGHTPVHHSGALASAGYWGPNDQLFGGGSRLKKKKGVERFNHQQPSTMWGFPKLGVPQILISTILN